MSKWRIWEDEYWGSDWNDRREVSSPEFKGMEIADDDIEENLLSYFIPEATQFVEIDGDDDTVYARMEYCLKCDRPAAKCQCDDDGDHYTYISYHATRVN